MKREIKLRAWDRKQNKMHRDSRYVLLCLADRFMPSYTNDKLDIMQYTGLKDKNGIEIYEGDIVKFMWNNEWISPVYWTDERGWTIHSVRVWEYNLAICYGIEVIGNIYENEELLNE